MQEELIPFFKEEKLIQIPKKQAKKLILFEYIINSYFENNQEYTEQAVNAILTNIYPDYAILRRYLVDYKYLTRDKYGKMYKKTAS